MEIYREQPLTLQTENKQKQKVTLNGTSDIEDETSDESWMNLDGNILRCSEPGARNLCWKPIKHEWNFECEKNSNDNLSLAAC